MKKLNRHIIASWLMLQVLFSSLGFTIEERVCDMSATLQQAEKISCCSISIPKEKAFACCAEASEIPEMPSESDCCSIDAQYHFFAFKSYFISSSESFSEASPTFVLPDFEPNVCLLKNSNLIQAFYAQPPPKNGRDILTLHSVLLI